MADSKSLLELACGRQSEFYKGPLCCHCPYGEGHRSGKYPCRRAAVVEGVECQWERKFSGRKVIGASGIVEMKETQKMLNFAAKHNIADIEVISMDYVNTAMERLAKRRC